MELYISPTSPFARKVRIALQLKGLSDRVKERIVDPWSDDAELRAVNPTLQVPAMRLDDGLALTDSNTMLNWLERSWPEPALWPQDPTERIQAEAVSALAHTLVEYAVFLVLEGRRPEAQRGAEMIARRRLAIARGVAALEARFHKGREAFLLDSINIACALEYLNFRLPDLGWRTHAPALGKWLEWASEQPVMLATRPPEG